MTEMIRALIFDMDGTLYESPGLERQYAEAVERYIAGQFEVSPGVARELFGEKRAFLAERLGHAPTTTATMKALGFDLRDWVAWRDAHIRPEEALGRDEPLRALLMELKARCVLVIVTNNSVEMTRRTLAAIGIEDLFEHVLTVEDMGLVKPDPEIYRRAAELAGVSPEECLSVGDRPPIDLEPAAAIGMKTFLATGPRELAKLRDVLREG